MKEELTQIKSDYLAERQRRRDQQTPSILDSMGLDSPEITAEQPEQDITLHTKPKACSVCNGAGRSQGLFRSFECYACQGTGFDLADMVAVIKWQQLCNEWAKKEVIRLRRDNERLKFESLPDEQKKLVEAERMEAAINKHYSKSNYRGD